jgi:hypothetical protein
MALAQARKAPGERRRVVDRRVGTDRRSILRLADGAAPRERRQQARRRSNGSASNGTASNGTAPHGTA